MPKHLSKQPSTSESFSVATKKRLAEVPVDDLRDPPIALAPANACDLGRFSKKRRRSSHAPPTRNTEDLIIVEWPGQCDRCGDSGQPCSRADRGQARCVTCAKTGANAPTTNSTPTQRSRRTGRLSLCGMAWGFPSLRVWTLRGKIAKLQKRRFAAFWRIGGVLSATTPNFSNRGSCGWACPLGYPDRPTFTTYRRRLVGWTIRSWLSRLKEKHETVTSNSMMV
ncbi:hypothetical protein C8Q79DRAFT_82136 [Trametes meyenii]|nr:hypothetical protein C8Q79DRAFT_82136 [Trametes meyenii]